MATRERLLRVLAAATFLIFFQAYMVAPLLPTLAAEFRASTQRVALAVPAYLIPYGVSTLAYGLLADRVGARPLLLGSLLAFVVLLLTTTTAHSATALIAWRVLAGLGASAVVPLALMWVGTNFSRDQRGRPLGWLFGAMAGGMAGGSSLGIMLEPAIGWRGTFCVVAVAGLFVFGWLFRLRQGLGARSTSAPTVHTALRGYRELLAWNASGRAYAFVLVNGAFHSGVFTWLGVYFKRQHGLSDVEIGAALLGYGVPGFLLGPTIGKVADRWGRARMAASRAVLKFEGGGSTGPDRKIGVLDPKGTANEKHCHEEARRPRQDRPSARFRRDGRGSRLAA